jgi:DNA-binding NtrC family response regulator
VFLDEINSASAALQLKLLRVLQERSFEPVGAAEPVSVDVRIVLATNQPLEELVAEGRFRQDLYYRINVITIDVPPLRDRLADIPLLADHFLDAKCAEMGRRINGFTEEALACFRAYPWPGNVRELENVVERAVVLTRSSRIDVVDLPEHVVHNRPFHAATTGVRGSEGGPLPPLPLRKALEAPEREIILAALEAHDWNRQATADALEINRTTLYKKIKQYGLAG